MASPVWVSGSSLAGGNSLTAAFTLPASLAAGDIVIAHFYRETNFSAVTAPDGTWTRKTTVATGTNIHEEQIWWKRCVGGETGTVTFTWTGTAAFRAGGIHRITGCRTGGDPFADFNTNFNNTASFTTPAVSLTGTQTDSLLIWIVSNFNGSSTWTPPGGYTTRASTVVDVGASKDNTAGGDTGSITGSSNQSDTMTAFLGLLSSQDAGAVQPVSVFPPIHSWILGTPFPVPVVIPALPPPDAITPIALDDTATAVDDATVTAAAPLTDTAVATDATTVAASVVLADTAVATDALSVTVPITLADTAAAADAATIAAAISLADTAVATDALNSTAAVSLPDTAVAADALALDKGVDQNQAGPQTAWMFLAPNAASYQLQGSSEIISSTTPALPDTATATDSLSITAVALTLADTATTTEAITAGVPISMADTAAAADSLTVTAAVPLADTATAADALTANAAVPLADTTATSETMAAGVPITLSDTATAADALAITVTLTLADVAAAADSLAVSVPITLSDTAVAADVLARTVTVSLTDLAAAADNLAIAATVALTQTATATDALSVSVPISLADTATATDALVQSAILLFEGTITGGRLSSFSTAWDAAVPWIDAEPWTSYEGIITGIRSESIRGGWDSTQTWVPGDPWTGQGSTTGARQLTASVSGGRR